jgi:hypothetical protein
MDLQRRAHGGAATLPQQGGALDVREDEGHRAGRGFHGHGESVHDLCRALLDPAPERCRKAHYKRGIPWPQASPGIGKWTEDPLAVEHRPLLPSGSENPITLKSGGSGWFYFSHSYKVDASDDVVAADAEHGESIPAIVASGLVFGIQPHPEKSGAAGNALLRRFLALGRSSSAADAVGSDSSDGRPS